jgi:hypothetical protein
MTANATDMHPKKLFFFFTVFYLFVLDFGRKYFLVIKKEEEQGKNGYFVIFRFYP